MRPCDCSAATAQTQITLLVAITVQLAVGPSANRHINIRFLSAHAQEAMPVCTGRRPHSVRSSANIELRFRELAILFLIQEIPGSNLGSDTELTPPIIGMVQSVKRQAERSTFGKEVVLFCPPFRLVLKSDQTLQNGYQKDHSLGVRRQGPETALASSY
jgi:hypothetical protein